MMAMRFLTAHEMTHILNGHLRLKLVDSATSSVSEAQYHLPQEKALFSQTLEMDADCGAVKECLQNIIFNEQAIADPRNSGLHYVYKSPNLALRLWTFAVYSIFRIFEENSSSIQWETASHPPPMVRALMTQGTAYEFMKVNNLKALQDLIPSIFPISGLDSEQAFAHATKANINFQPVTSARNAAGYVKALLKEWGHIRPLLEPLNRGVGKLAPVSEQ
jgi:hypothetical protein